MVRGVALVGCLALLVATAGCLSGVPQSGGPADSPSPSPTGAPADGPGGTPQAYHEATTTPEPLAGGANCSADLGVRFWGLNEPRLWESNEVRFVGDVPADATYLFVAYVDGTVRGVNALSGDEGGVHVDGGAVPVEGDLAGDHHVRIVVHQDADGDGAFDPETDPPCRAAGELVQTDYLVVDFDRYW